MKLIFSRKGYDSSSGGFPSPIFPDGSMVSIPIPGKDGKRYSELPYSYDGKHISEILNELTKGKITYNKKTKTVDYFSGKHEAHYDPQYISADNYCGYVLGQHSGAQGHLLNNNVGRGDIFIFYGLFCEVGLYKGKWQYLPGGTKKHVIFGWMQVGEIDNIRSQNDLDTLCKKYSFMVNHPHSNRKYLELENKYKNNTIYFAEQGEELSLFDENKSISTSNRFLKYHSARCLTKKDNGNKVYPWSLPLFMDYGITIMKKEISQNEILLNHVGYGQEFVMDLGVVSPNDKSEVSDHLIKLFTN